MTFDISKKMFTFPSIIDIDFFHDEQIMEKNNELSQNLLDTKNLINNQKKWDIAKKYANEYEYIFSFNNEGIADITPTSRSYFKLIEIIHDFNIFGYKNVACICEGPGGFIQAINEITNVEVIDCITLLSGDKKIPNWKNIERFKNIIIHSGIDGTGDLYNIENVEDFIENVGTNTKDLVTADGGFDFSNDFNSQETKFQKLLLTEIYTNLNIQKKGGVFIVKIFDLFDKNTIQYVSVLRLVYEKVVFHKPKTSRPANSEKYIICINLKYIPCTLINSIKQCLIRNENDISHIVNNKMYIDTLRNVYKYNRIFTQNQMNYINKTIDISYNLKATDKYRNINYCIDWCNKYNVGIKNSFIN
jgi:23S rRNA U2552 (ribose-2'-O)-methylase RlmE/FtsJ